MYYMAEIGKNTSLYKPPNASNASNASSNFSNFRNYPNYFYFLFINLFLQTFFIFSRTARRKSILEKTPAYTSPQTLQTLQTPLPTFPISATTLIIFLPIYKFILQKIFSIFGKTLPSSNFSNFRNYPNYFLAYL